MSTIGSLIVNLGLASASFSAGLNKAHKDLGKFGASVKSFATSTTGILTGVAGAFGVAFGANALKNFIGGQMEAIDQVAKLSDRLGITTESLVGLQHGAALAGVSTEQLTGGLEKMLKAIGEAAAKGGTTAEAFDAMGLSARNLSGMATGDAFTEIAQKLSEITNPAERARLAVAVFGKAGQELLPMMLQGAAGIEAAQKEAERLGLTFSRVDAAKVEAANDAMTRLGEVVTGIGRTLAIELAPFIDALATKFTDAASAGEGLGRRVINAFEWMLTGIAKVADWLELLKVGFYGLKTTIAGVFMYAIEIAREFAEQLLVLIDLIPGMGDAVAEVRAAFDGLEEGFRNTATESAAAMQEAWRRFNEGANSKAVAQTFADIRRRADEAAQAVARAVPAIAPIAADSIFKFDNTGGMNDDPFGLKDQYKLLVDMKADADSLRKSLRPPTQVYGDELNKLNQMLQAGAIDYKTWLDGIAQAQDKLKQDAGIDGKAQKAALKEQRFSFTYRAEKQGNDPAMDIRRLQLAEARKHTKSLETVARSLGGNGNQLALAVVSIEE